MPNFTPNKGYITQLFGENAGTWGTTLNSQMIEYVDLNLGGLKNQSLSNTNVTLSTLDSRNVIYRLTGALGANVIVTLETTSATANKSGFLIVENLTSGAFTISIRNSSVATAATVDQNTRALLISDNINGVRIAAQTYTNLVNTFSAGSTGLTPSTGTTGNVTLAGTLNVANGGTGLTTLTANNVILGNGASTPQFVAPGTSGNFLTSNGTTWTSSTYVPLNYGTLTSSASGSFVDFNNVFPSTTKRINILFWFVSTTGVNEILIQLGVGLGPTYLTSGYASNCSRDGGTAGSTTGFIVTTGSDTNSFYNGIIQLMRLDPSNNLWVLSSQLNHYINNSSASIRNAAGAKQLDDVLTSVRVTANGNTFDNGLINVTWES